MFQISQLYGKTVYIRAVMKYCKNFETPEKSFLLSYKEISSVNHTTAAHIFNEAVQTLWPDGVKGGNIMLPVTGSTLYMK
jgi:hypothetical protein